MAKLRKLGNTNKGQQYRRLLAKKHDTRFMACKWAFCLSTTISFLLISLSALAIAASVTQEDERQPTSADSDFVGQFGSPFVEQKQQLLQPMKRNIAEREQDESKKNVGKLTTLLEDENEDLIPKNTTTSSTISSTVAPLLPVSADRSQQATNDPSAQTTEKRGFIRSLFDRVYKQVANYVPTSLWGHSKSNNNSSEATQEAKQVPLETHSLQVDETTKPEIGLASNGTKLKKNQDDRLAGQANQDVSATSSANDQVVGIQSMKRDDGSLDDNKDEDEKFVGLFAEGGGGGQETGKQKEEDKQQLLDKVIRLRLEKVLLKDSDDQLNMASKRVNSDASESALNNIWPSEDSQDRLSTASKYVYAPTQHYYLNALPSTAGSLPSQAFEVLHTQQQQQRHQLPQHFRPGDQVLAAATQQQQQQQQHFGDNLEPSYAYQRQDSAFAPLMLTTSQLAAAAANGNPNGGKQNDLYFLVMFGAFCLMAMAVVLAAGLFAYRVQQQRKSSQSQTEYPTYGVVGPNNMSGKCGAAAFVGGYFAGPTGGAQFVGNHHLGGTKSSSAKHLPDLYAAGSLANCGAGGGPGSDSGLASLDNGLHGRGGSKKMANNASGNNNNNNQDAARMYHYQHQKQQMIVSDRSSAGRHTSASDLDSEDENDDGSYTVYECPGLASAHEMEIKNPLFNDERTP